MLEIVISQISQLCIIDITDVLKHHKTYQSSVTIVNSGLKKNPDGLDESSKTTRDAMAQSDQSKPHNRVSLSKSKNKKSGHFERKWGNKNKINDFKINRPA
ncbi:hypothetical protein KIL84_016779 [Mauremys mutica]|uniref:Uncharacterized protein n=1 Tax=Mauremys mutica TaxID=74926 RepID=A0A9D3X5L0_9SAUR|nr:hypothetical protein KIL84_016779 [Mauremys mutica]